MRNKRAMLFRINIKIVIFLSAVFLLISCMHVMDLDKIPVSTISLWRGVKSMGNTNWDYAEGVVVDNLGSTIVVGHTNGALDLNGDGDTSDGSAEDATGYGNTDIFISKYDVSGNWSWSKRLGGAGSDYSYGVAVDSNNNIIVVGRVLTLADLNGDGDSSDGGAEDPTGYDMDDGVISKFDSSGNWLWSERLGGDNLAGDAIRAVAVDDNNNIIVTGYVNFDADLNGDMDRLDGVAETGVGYGDSDIFVSKFDASGNWAWSKRLGGTSGDLGLGVAVDNNGGVIVSGETASNPVDLNGDGDMVDGSVETTSYGSSDVFISKFDSSGSWLWSKKLGGAGLDEGGNICTDSSNNIIVTGQVFFPPFDLNGDGDMVDGSVETTSYGADDVFVSKFDSSGNWLWGKTFGGAGSDYGCSVDADSNNNVFVAGYISGTADLNGDGDSSDGGAEDATGFVGLDIFISKFDDSGSWLEAKRLGGTGTDRGHDIFVSGNDYVVTGAFGTDADLDGDGIKESTSAGNTDAFFTRF